MLWSSTLASETNESYKSIPFYMSSAGYGLFFHNFYPSAFDVGASFANTGRDEVLARILIGQLANPEAVP